MAVVYLCLGSNLSDREQNLKNAILSISGNDFQVTAVSSLYESEPVGVTEQPVPDYLNVVIKAETDLDPISLLDLTQSIELLGGRTPTFYWGPRTIDIDILLYGDSTVDCERLTIPHSRMKDRLFVLRPLLEIAPSLVLPDGSELGLLVASNAVASQKLHRIKSNLFL